MRKIASVLLAVSCLLLRLSATAQSTEVAGRAVLLNGVTEVVVPGGIPGDFVVFGDKAFVVMTGRMGKARLPLCAAAPEGRGRVVVVGHEGFFGGAALQHPAGLHIGLVDQSGELKATLTAVGCIVTTFPGRDLPGAAATLDALWINQASLDGAENRARLEQTRRWVAAGHGLVITGPAWGWQYEHSSGDLTRDHSGNLLVLPAGIAFATGELEPTGKQGFVADINENGSEEAPALARPQQALTALEDQASGKRTLTAVELAQVTTVLSQAVGALPESQTGLIKRVEKLCANQGGDMIPTKQTPITAAMPFARLKATLDAQQWRRLPADKVMASPSAASFPGSVPADAKRVTQTVTVDTTVPEWHGLGLYAAPGEIVTVTVPAAAAGKGLAIRIGAHTDTLWHLDRWERFPEITQSRPLNAATIRVASPFGGTLYLDVPQGCKLGAVPVTVVNAVAAPRYVRGVTSVEEWKQSIRNAPGPWAEMEGKLVILTVPSYAVRDLDDPEALMSYWDEVMEHCYALYAAPKRNRPERYCGYPIMTGDDVARTFCDLGILRGNVGIKCWGFYHEMGHNFQRPEWTWEAFGEVTNNLFSLYGTETLNDVKVGAHPAMTADQMMQRERTVAAAPGSAHYYEKDPWYPLTMFWLMRREFGWEPFTKLFAEFRDLPNAEKPQTELEKHNQFLVRFCKLTGHNLTNYLTAWGIETTEPAHAAVASLPTWMPSDWP